MAIFQLIKKIHINELLGNGWIQYIMTVWVVLCALYAREKALLADAVTLTSAGIPMILQGSEFLQDGSFNDWAALEWRKTEKYAGILLAHKHLLALRHNAYDTTRGLQGNSTALFHTNDDNCVIGYHR